MKADTRAPQGFQLNIEVPKKQMEVLHINFTEVNGKFVITVVDRFSIRGWFVLLTATDASSDVHSILKAKGSGSKVSICNRNGLYLRNFGTNPILPVRIKP